ncbi:S-methyl-5-thioribose kinase [Propionimicrobium sp. PCR01-08-3]|uniref:S-methyl-5-thioribose kinase n=1 Tax=Propionimicrobium sp. PCR01-08-3 TaxID=3052086 RepID=UPI00255CF7A1|nr:S-methyl-5-thioribose kinase [Propionimicrobium sp. PCR01-08-3]WIY82403.1 S-methyl-5-thioribose kinase [Propionimicrobium sp. PCR01-08-3]
MADYEFLNKDNLADYIRSKPELSSRINADDIAKFEEVGDGNLNMVFLLADSEGKRLCIKQALPYVRMTGEGWPMTPDRARHEALALSTHHELTPDLVPELYLYDPQRYIIAMQDLSDHKVWRQALCDGEINDGAAEAMGRYVGAVAFGTSLFALERQEYADAIAEALNPEICTITEDLVFTEPLVDAGRNVVLDANVPDMLAFQQDREMFDAMGYAKWAFMTRTEALIHGDLHTGSVFVRNEPGTRRVDSVKAFDSEFSFYGPLAFDLGALFANYIAAAARAYALGEDDRAGWRLSLIEQTWEAFEAEFRDRWPDRRDPRVWGDDFLESRLATWQSEAWLFAAAKMSRRIIGAAKNKDIESLPEHLREGAARGILNISRQAVRQRDSDHSPTALAELSAQILTSDRTG